MLLPVILAAVDASEDPVRGLHYIHCLLAKRARDIAARIWSDQPIIEDDPSWFVV